MSSRVKMVKDPLRIFILLILLTFLVFPYLVLGVHFDVGNLMVGQDFWRSLSFTMLQASLSSIVTIAFGLFGAYGLIYSRQRYSSEVVSGMRFLAIVPSVFPSLLLILAYLNLAPRNVSPLVSIVIVHSWMNVGIVAVALEELLVSVTARYAAVAEVMGAGKWTFFRRIVFWNIDRDLLVVGLSIFAMCTASFSIPLILGGRGATTLEVLIFEKLRSDQTWGLAVWYSFIQSALVLGLSLMITKRNTRADGPMPNFGLRLLSNSLGLVPVLLPMLCLSIGLSLGLGDGVQLILKSPIFFKEMVEGLIGSVFIGIGVGLCSLGLCILILYVYPVGSVRKVLLGHLAPSVVVFGFAMVSLGLTGELSLVMGLSVLFFPFFYRFYLDSFLGQLSSQVQLVKTMGGSSMTILTRIVLPQAWSRCCGIAAFASFWSWGDISLSKMVLAKPSTLSLQISSLMESYRLSIATVEVWILVFGGLITFFLFRGLGNVGCKKS